MDEDSCSVKPCSDSILGKRQKSKRREGDECSVMSTCHFSVRSSLKWHSSVRSKP